MLGSREGYPGLVLPAYWHIRQVHRRDDYLNSVQFPRLQAQALFD